jgi:transcriptional regulator with GAF, ATPase, and Fis domain
MTDENQYERNLKLESIIKLSSMLNHETSFEEMLRLISVKTLQLFGCDFVTLSILNPETQNTVKTVLKDEKEFDSKLIHLVNINIAGWAIDNKSSFLSNDLPNDERFKKGLLENCGIKSAIGVLLTTNDKPIGVLLILGQNPNKLFAKVDLNLAENLAAVIPPFVYRLEKIQQYFNCNLPNDELINKYSKLGLIGRSERFLELLKSVESVAKCDVRVLLEGETGTGKELIAKAIHKASHRSDNKFVVVDCSAISFNLIESELFGHVKGSFTGAMKDRIGLVEEADGGTLFIDEINHFPAELQAKMLRFLQENEFRPVGSNEVRKSDVRVIAASGVSLIKLVEQGKMREELFYRLNVYPVIVPSLNDRTEDITLLAYHFLVKFAVQQHKKIEAFDSELSEYLLNRHWKGNIRELENFIERLVTVASSFDKIISKEILPAEYQKEFENLKILKTTEGSNPSLIESLAQTEIQLIREALVNNDWNQSKTARALKIPEQTLRHKMHRLHITKPN